MHYNLILKMERTAWENHCPGCVSVAVLFLVLPYKKMFGKKRFPNVTTEKKEGQICFLRLELGIKEDGGGAGTNAVQSMCIFFALTILASLGGELAFHRRRPHFPSISNWEQGRMPFHVVFFHIFFTDKGED